MLRLNHLNIIQGSFYVRNVLVQPGPLSAPVEERSMDEPSFRLVSLGRWRGIRHVQEKESFLGAKRAFQKGKDTDVGSIMVSLGLINGRL